MKILKVALIAIGLIIIVFGGVIFLPGFFHSVKNTPTQIQSASILGLDKAIVSAHFTVYYHSADEIEAKQLISSGEADYSALSGFFPNTPKTEILLTNSTDEYVNVFNAAPPWGGEAYKDPKTSAGSFCPGCTKSLGTNTEYIYMLRPKNTGFSHELAHRYYWASYPNIRQDNSLVWLNEGLAVYVQNEVSGHPGPGGLTSSALPDIKNFPFPGSFAELNQLQQAGGNSTQMFYDLVGLMAYYIGDKTGDKGLKGFISELNTTQNLEKTVQDKFGFGSSELFAKWKQAVTQTAAQNPSDFLKSFRKLVIQ